MISFTLVLLGLTYVSSANNWNDCGGLATVKSAKYPDPIVLRGGESFKFSGSVFVPPSVGNPHDFKVEVQMQYKRYVVWYPVPCFNGVGSCTYYLNCTSLASLVDYKGRCPLPAGLHSTTDDQVILPKFDSTFIPNGLYWVKAQIKDLSNRLLSCVEIYANVVT